MGCSGGEDSRPRVPQSLFMQQVLSETSRPRLQALTEGLGGSFLSEAWSESRALVRPVPLPPGAPLVFLCVGLSAASVCL